MIPKAQIWLICTLKPFLASLGADQCFGGLKKCLLLCLPYHLEFSTEQVAFVGSFSKSAWKSNLTV